MPLWKPKKILFIGTHPLLLKILAKENETEVVSSINYIENLSMRFLPDLIIADSLTKENVMTIRKISRFASIPILIAAEKITAEEIDSLIPFPNIILCNAIICTQGIFIEHLKSIMDKRKKISPAKTGAIIKKTVYFIDSNIDKKISRKLISKEIGTDQDYMTRIFHREMGITMWNYLNIMRLEEAKNLLAYTGLTVKEIARKCGFTTAAYFCNRFKKHYGLSPDEARMKGA